MITATVKASNLSDLRNMAKNFSVIGIDEGQFVKYVNIKNFKFIMFIFCLSLKT